MNVRMRLFASYRETVGMSEVEIEVADGADVAALVRAFEAKYPVLAGRCEGAMVAVNSEYASQEARIRPGDEVALIPPVSGGATAQSIAAGITREVLNAQAIAWELRRPSNGAVVVFEGVVRDNNLGRRVLYLEYEAYVEMAERMLQRIGHEVGQTHEVQEMALWHRIGRLEIGETSLVVVVAAPHRKEAFAACQEAVERVKALVPIWKKEVWEGGAEWLGGAG